MLHIVNKSPFERNALESCLRFGAAGSAVLLIEDGVYAATRGNAAEPKVREAMRADAGLCAAPDLEARGMQDAVIDGVKLVDYGGFVDLVAEHNSRAVVVVAANIFALARRRVMSFELNGKTYETDEEGYLVNLADWNEDVANFLAEQEKVDLSPNHWEVVNFLREYYNDYQIAPAVRVLTKAIGKKLGPDKGNSKYLYELFPYGPAKQACKIAGLPKPTGCI